MDEQTVMTEVQRDVGCRSPGCSAKCPISNRIPEYFALMFLDRSVPRVSQQWDRFAFVRDTMGLLLGRLRDAAGQGLLPEDLDPEAAFNVLVASVRCCRHALVRSTGIRRSG